MLKRDYNRMLELGGNIYFTAKLGATDGHSFRHLAAIMTGSTAGGLCQDDARPAAARSKAIAASRGATRSRRRAAKSAKPKSAKAKSKSKSKSVKPKSKAKSRSKARSKRG